MTNLDSTLKSRDITLSTKIHLVKAMLFPVVMYGCESWTIKKSECRRIDAFELWCWRRLFRVPWTASISNQSILKEISPDCSLERLILRLKLQSFGHLMRRLTHLKILWCWERFKERGEGHDRGWDDWMTSLTQWTWVWVTSASWWWTGRPGVLRFMGSQRVGHDWATELNWTEEYSNYHTSALISHTGKVLLKILLAGFNCVWTVNFQTFKLDLEKAEEPEIKLPTSDESSKKQESSRKTFISALLTIPKPLTVWITTNSGKFL